MRKTTVLCLALMLLILLCGCAGGVWDEKPAQGIDNTADYENETNDVSSEEPVYSPLYYANRKSKKFHKSNCAAIGNMKDDNLYLTEYRDELINEGYKPCSICNP